MTGIISTRQAEGRLSISDQLREIHANVLPGVTRPEEGETVARSTSRSPIPGHVSGTQSYAYRERQRNQDRYDSYLDERDNEMLPNAFDLGWKRNMDMSLTSPLKWFLPICTTTGDGWLWEPSPKWLATRDRMRREREVEEQAQKQRELAAGWGSDSPTEADFRRPTRGPNGWQPAQYSQPMPRPTRRPEWQSPLRRGEQHQYLTTSNGIVRSPKEGRRSPSKADQILGKRAGHVC